MEISSVHRTASYLYVGTFSLRIFIALFSPLRKILLSIVGASEPSRAKIRNYTPAGMLQGVLFRPWSQIVFNEIQY